MAAAPGQSGYCACNSCVRALLSRRKTLKQVTLHRSTCFRHCKNDGRYPGAMDDMCAITHEGAQHPVLLMLLRQARAWAAAGNPQPTQTALEETHQHATPQDASFAASSGSSSMGAAANHTAAGDGGTEGAAGVQHSMSEDATGPLQDLQGNNEDEQLREPGSAVGDGNDSDSSSDAASWVSDDEDAEPDLPGLDVDALRNLRSRQPGFDGGKIKRRFERRAFPSGLERSHRVLVALQDVLLTKAKNLKMSESAAEDHLATIRENFLRDDRPDLADLVPSCYKAAMSALETAGYVTWPKSVHYDLCPCFHIYRCESRAAQQCPVAHCKRSRSEAKNFVTYPIRYWAPQLYSTPQTAKEIATWMERQSKDGIMRDWFDGRGVSMYVTCDARFKADGRHLSLMLIQDPFQPFDDDARVSLSPFMCVCLNLRPANRFRLGLGAHMLGIFPGKAQMSSRGGAGVAHDPHPAMLALIRDEVNWLNGPGIRVYDAYTRNHFTLHAKLIMVLSDLKGHEDFLDYPSGLQCLKCNKAPGTKLMNNGKSPWHNHWPMLPLAHPLRPLCCPLHNRTKRPRDPALQSRLRYRTQQEAATRVGNLPQQPAADDDEHPTPFPPFVPGTRQARSWQAPAQTSTAGYGNAGASGGDHPFATLRGFNFRDMVVIDPMHTIGGVAKDLVDLLLYDKDIVSINVQDHERTVNNRDFGTTYRASINDRHAFYDFLGWLIKRIPSAWGGSRLERLGCASKKPRTHHFFVLASPLGTTALSQLKGLPEAMRLTIINLFNALSVLWMKEVAVADVPGIQARVVEAICALEAHLPASEADHKMHNLLHLAFDSLPTWGPLFTASMFRAESCWGTASKAAHNRRHTAATIVNALADVEATSFAAWRHPERVPPRLMPVFDDDDGQDCPVPEQAVLDEAVPRAALKVEHRGDRRERLNTSGVARLFQEYRRLRNAPHPVGCPTLAPAFALWDAFVDELTERAERGDASPKTSLVSGVLHFEDDASWHKHICIEFPAWLRARARQQARQEARQLAALAITMSDFGVVRPYGKAHVSGLELQTDSSFLARRSMLSTTEAASLWFGTVLQVLMHVGPDGRQRLWFKVTWRRTLRGSPANMFDHWIRAPVVEAAALRENCNHFWPAEGVVPWPTWAYKLPWDQTKQVMLARHWGVLRPLGWAPPPAAPGPIDKRLLRFDPGLKGRWQEWREQQGQQEEADSDEEARPRRKGKRGVAAQASE